MRALASVRNAPVQLSARLHGGDPEAGMSTAEYAVGTVAACGFGGVLYKVVTSPAVLELIQSTITRALGIAF